METGDPIRSRIYFGRVWHKRFRPKVHQFAYRVFSMIIDLDEAPTLGARLRWFSHNRWNLLSFHDADHGPRDGTDPRRWLEAAFRGAGLTPPGGPIRIHCFPRVFGFVFNPLSTWFCYDREERLAYILYEVTNTFGKWRSYLLPVKHAEGVEQRIEQGCEKAFYVSPFMSMDAEYKFFLHEPDEALDLAIHQWERGAPTLTASHKGEAQTFSDRTILRAMTAYPLMTLKVVIAIHWEALNLLRKGVRFHWRKAAKTGDVLTVEGRPVSPPEFVEHASAPISATNAA